ncbi:hypothetical protein POJ06DRAFT_248247 [Lipomyces tetrasporus]|uniref:Uncharacterized protein n=1 Tax=Lipomyces tetrasporus TaxID=54092 RepID=A0AAD7QUS9_9ASCO|nr:uncharacterized protein POJ06DRAFT_248247 [Lipomyces tetrasporus]KAJ8101922.1 hypothetical protein POJ06DRAFT_248247 [Lipomyces tetrasporus]
MNVFPDRNDPFGSQSTLQLSFTTAHRVPRTTYSKRGRSRDRSDGQKQGSGSSAIAVRTNLKVARVKEKDEGESDIFEFHDDETHEPWAQRTMKKGSTARVSDSDAMESESSSSNRRSSPSPSAPVGSVYLTKGSKSKTEITPGGTNAEVPPAPRRSILLPSKTVLKEFVNEAWKGRHENKMKEEDGDGTLTLTKRPAKVRIVSKAEEIIVKPASEVEDDNQAPRRRSRAKSKSSIKQEKPVTPTSTNRNPKQTRLSNESQLQRAFAIANDPNYVYTTGSIVPQHSTSTSLPARMKRINLSSDNGNDLSSLEVAPPSITASNQYELCEEDEIEDDDNYDLTGPISTSTPNATGADVQRHGDETAARVPETKKLFTIKTETGRSAISPVKHNRNDTSKRVTLGGIPDLSVPRTTQSTTAPMKKARSGISVYRDVPGISPVKHGSVSERDHNMAVNMGIKTGERKQSGLQSVVQSHVRVGSLSKSGKKDTKQPTSSIEPSSSKRSMSRYGRRVIYEDDEEDELAM